MDHTYEQPYCVDSEDTQDMFSEDSVFVADSNSDADAILIDTIRGYPHLYAKNLKDFKDKNVRERSWIEIASILHCSGMRNYLGLQLNIFAEINTQNNLQWRIVKDDGYA